MKKAPVDDDQTIAKAIEILNTRLRKPDTFFTNPDDAKNFAVLKLAKLHAERFAVFFLNTKHGLIEYREMFYGTIDGATVHPREVAREALRLNAAAVIFAHNHPSGNIEPSTQDLRITRKLQECLNIFEIQVLDHIIVGGTDTTSMAERGMI